MRARKTQNQSNKSIKKQTSPEGPSQLFSEAFDKAEKLLKQTDKLDEKIDKAAFGAQKKRLQRKKIGLDRSFDRLTRYPELTPLINEYVGQNGGRIASVKDLMNYLRSCCPSLTMIEDPALRAHLKRAYGIAGERH